MADLIVDPRESSYVLPIQRIPTEILSEVFLYCAPAHRDPEKHGFRREVILPSHVSQSWRNTAIATPQLWSCIMFDIDHRPGHSLGFEFAEVWLSRAGICNLSLVISAHIFNMTEDQIPKTQAALDLVTARCTQWQHVKICLPLSAFKMMTAIRGHVPKLESLKIFPSFNESVTPPIINLFDVAPQLRDFSCGHVWVSRMCRFLFDYAMVPWGQLSQYEGGSYTVRDWLHIMRESSSLVECNIWIEMCGPTFVPVFTQLPYLATWKLYCYENPSLLFNSLILPALNEFHLTTSHNWGHRSFIALLSRSSCILTRLTVSLLAYTPNTMKVLEYTPHLTYLCVTSREGGAAANIVLMLKLSISNTAVNGLVPMLQTLTFDVLESAGAAFADVVESRWKIQGGAFSATVASLFNRIDRIYLDSKVCFGSQTTARFEGFAVEGLVVTIQ